MIGVSAVICEFDPLHRGHRRVIEEAKCHGDTVLAVMSGNFTQRSECALFDKYSRAKAAVECGCDLVVELPFPWSCAGAEFFACGGVGVALSLGADSFVFGSESGDPDLLSDAADLISQTEFYKTLGCEKAEGAARAHDAIMKDAGFDVGENDKLAINYIKASKRLHVDPVHFYPVKRVPLGYGASGASAIRALFREGREKEAAEYIDPVALLCYEETETVRSSAHRLSELEFLYFRFFRDVKTPEAFEATGGVSNLLYRAAKEASCYRDFFALAATKKYTNSRIRRAALYSMLGVNKEDLVARPAVTVLLAANERGKKYLSENSFKDINVLTKPSGDVPEDACRRQISLIRRADELFSLCAEKGAPFGRFLRMSPYIK